MQMLTDETETDHFDWLPAALVANGRPGAGPPVERVTLRTRSGTVSGLRWGDADPVAVLLHGAGQNAHTWDLVAALAGVPVLALDLPGHGRSAWRADRDYSPQRNAVTIAAALDSMELRPEAFVGMSLGGLSAFALLSARPELVRRSLIVDILPRIGSASLSEAIAGDRQVALIDGPREFSSIAEMLALAARAAPERPLADLRRGVVHNAIRTEDGRYRWRYDDLDVARVIPHTDLWEAIEGSIAPLTLIRGGASAFVPAASVEHLRRVRPDAHVLTVDGAPHAVQSVAPVRIVQSLQELLDQQLRVPDTAVVAVGMTS